MCLLPELLILGGGMALSGVVLLYYSVWRRGLEPRPAASKTD